MELVEGGRGEIPEYLELGMICQFDKQTYCVYIATFPNCEKLEKLYFEIRNIWGDPRKFEEGMYVSLKRGWSPHGPTAENVSKW